MPPPKVTAEPAQSKFYDAVPAEPEKDSEPVSTAPMPRPSGLDPASFPDSRVGRIFGGDPREWTKFRASETKQREKAVESQRREFEARQKKEEAAAADEARKQSYLDVLGRGQEPDLDQRTGTYYPKLDPATGMPSRRTFTTGERDVAGSGKYEVKPDDQGKMVVQRPKLPNLRINDDGDLMRGDLKLDPVMSLFSNDAAERLEAGKALRKMREKEFDKEGDEIKLALGDPKFESVSPDAVKKAREKGEEFRNDDDRRIISVFDEQEKLKARQREIAKEAHRLRYLKPDAWEQELRQQHSADGDRIIRENAASVVERHAAETADLESQRKALQERQEKWSQENARGVPSAGFEAHARESADIRTSQAALDALEADLRTRHEADRRGVEDVMKQHAGDRAWEEEKRARESENIGKAITGAEQALGAVRGAFGGTSPTSPPSPSSPSSPPTPSTPPSPLHDNRGKGEFDRIRRDGDGRIALRSSKDGWELDSGYERLPEIMASPSMQDGGKPRDIFKPVTVEGDGYESAIRARPEYRERANRLIAGIRDLRARVAQDSGVEMLRNSGAPDDIVEWEAGRTQARFAKEFEDQTRELNNLRFRAMQGQVPLNLLLEAWREAGMDSRVAPDVNQVVDSVGSAREQDAGVQERRLAALKAYVAEWQDTPFFDEAKVSGLMGKQAEQTHRERLRRDQGLLAMMGKDAVKIVADISVGAIEGTKALFYTMTDNEAGMKQVLENMEAYDTGKRSGLWDTFKEHQDQFGRQNSAGDWGLFASSTFAEMLPQIVLTAGSGALAASVGKKVFGGVLKFGYEGAAKQLMATGMSRKAAVQAVKAGVASEAKAGTAGTITKAVQESARQAAEQMGMRGGLFAASVAQNGGEYIGTALRSFKPEDAETRMDEIRRAVWGAAVAGVPAGYLDMLDANEAKLAQAVLGMPAKQLRKGIMAGAGRMAREFGLAIAKEGATGFGQGVLGVMSQRWTSMKPFGDPVTPQETEEVVMNMIGEAIGGGQANIATVAIPKIRTAVQTWRAGMALRVAQRQAEAAAGEIPAGMPRGPVGDLERALADAEEQFDAAVREGRTDDALTIRRQQVSIAREMAGRASEQAALAEQAAREVSGSPVAQAVLKVAGGAQLETMTDAEVGALGYERGPKGGVRPMKDVAQAVTRGAGGGWIITDETIAEVGRLSPSGAAMIGDDEATARAKDAARELESAGNPPASAATGSSNSKPPDRESGNPGATPGPAAASTTSGEAVTSDEGVNPSPGLTQPTKTNEKRPRKSPAAPPVKPDGAEIPPTVPKGKPAKGESGEFAATVEGSDEPVVVRADSEADARAKVGKRGKKVVSVERLPDAGTVSVPLMVTKDMRRQLADLGYSRADVDAMKPSEANEIITGQKTKQNPASAPDNFQSAKNPQVEVKGGDKSASKHFAEAQRQLGERNGSEDKALRQFFDAGGKFLPAFAGVFERVEWKKGSENSGGMSVTPDGKTLVLSLPDISRAMGKVRDREQWALAAMVEEALHVVQIQLEADGKVNTDRVADLLRVAAPNTFKTLAAGYPGAGPHLGKEIMRMVLQNRLRFTVAGVELDGVLTEETYTPETLSAAKRLGQTMLEIFKKVRAALERLFTDAPPNVSKAVQAYCDAAEARLRELMTNLPDKPAPAPVESAQAAPASVPEPSVVSGEGTPVSEPESEWKRFPSSLGIPRDQMPQVKADDRSALVQFLRARGINYSEEEVLPDTLQPSQVEYSEAKVKKAAKRTASGEGDRAILVSADNYVVDGHHQWMAQPLGLPMRIILLDAPIRDVLAAVAEFPSAETADGEKPNPIPEAKAPATGDQPGGEGNAGVATPPAGSSTGVGSSLTESDTKPAEVKKPTVGESNKNLLGIREKPALDALESNTNPTPTVAENATVQKPAENPSEAVQEVKDHLKEQSPRSQAEIKREIVARIETALAESLAEESDEAKRIRSEMGKAQAEFAADEKPSASRTRWHNERMNRFRVAIEQANRGVKKITIEIPGDGTFTVFKTPEILSDLLKKAKALPTKVTPLGAPVAVERGGKKPVDYGVENPEDPRELERARAALAEAIRSPQYAGQVEHISMRIRQMESVQGVSTRAPSPVPTVAKSATVLSLSDFTKGDRVTITKGRHTGKSGTVDRVAKGAAAVNVALDGGGFTAVKPQFLAKSEALAAAPATESTTPATPINAFDEPPMTEPTAPGVSPDDIVLEVAQRAHSGTSWVPERRARGEQREYVRHMNAVWQELSGRAETNGERATAETEFSRYRRNWVSNYLALLSSRSGLVSTMIAGASKFPAASQRKKGDAYANRLNSFLEWDRRAQRAMREAVRPTPPRIISADRSDAVEALQEKINAAKADQEMMKRVNAAHRAFLKNPASLDATDFTDAVKEKIRSYVPRFSWEPNPFAPYELSNNQANIKRMEERMARVSRTKSAKPRSATFDGGRVEENADNNRIQIFFDRKPPEEMREKLKSRGFRWAPSEGAWQRQRTADAAYAAEGILGVKLTVPESAPVESQPVAEELPVVEFTPQADEQETVQSQPIGDDDLDFALLISGDNAGFVLHDAALNQRADSYEYTPAEFTGRDLDAFESAKRIRELPRDAAAAEAPGAVRESLRRAERETGIAVRFFTAGPTDDKLTTGFVHPDYPQNLFINGLSKRPLAWTFTHEWTHAAERDSAARQAKDDLEQKLRNLAKPEILEQAEGLLRENYPADEVPAELMAHLIPDALAKESVFGSELMFDDWPAVQKMVREFWDSVNPLSPSALEDTSSVGTQSPDSWQQSADDLNAELDALVNALNQGERIGDPSRAYSMADAQMRAVDEWNKQAPAETREQWREEAELLREALGTEEALRRIIAKGQAGETLTPGETMLAKEMLMETGRNMKGAGLERARVLRFAYRLSRKGTARTMVAGVDEYMTPAERMHKFLTGVAMDPNEAAQKAAAQKRQQANQADTDAQAEALRKEADAIEDRSSREQLAKVTEALKKNGFTLDEFLNTEVRITEKAPVFERMLAEMATWKAQALRRMQGGDIPFKRIARETGRAEKEIRAVRSEFEAKFTAWALQRIQPGMTADDLIGMMKEAGVKSQPVGGMSDDAKHALIQEAMMKMGLVPPDKQGKARVRTKRDGKRTPLDPDTVARLTLERWKNRQSRAVSAVGTAVKDYTKAGDATDEARDALRDRLIGMGVGTDNAVEMAELARERMLASRMGERARTMVYVDMEDAESVVTAAKAMSATRGDVFDMIREYWYASVLSGWKTQLVNAASYPLHLLLNTGITRSVAATLNKAFGFAGAGNQMAPQLGELGIMWKAALPGIVDAARLAVKAWKTGHDFLAFDKMHDKLLSAKSAEDAFKMLREMGLEVPASAIPGKFGKVVRLPMAAMQFVDVFGKTIVAHMEAAAWAYRIAKRDQKASGQTFPGRAAKMADLEGRMTTQLYSHPSEAWKNAIHEATEAGFQTPLRGGRVPTNRFDAAERSFAKLIGKLDSWLNEKKAGDLGLLANAGKTLARITLFPFMRTPYNLMRAGMRKTPFLGTIPFVIRTFEAGVMHMMGKKGFADVYGKFFDHAAEQTLAWIAYFTLRAIAEGDDDDDQKPLLITGGPLPGRSDRPENMARDAQQGGNFNIRVGTREHGTLVNYGRYEPLATALGTTVDIIRASKMDSDTTSGNKVARAVAGIMGQMEQKTFLRGLADMMAVYESIRYKDGARAKGMALSLAGAIVPNIIKQPIRDTDAYLRDWKSAQAGYQFVPVPDAYPIPGTGGVLSVGGAEQKINPSTGAPVEKAGATATRVMIPTGLKTGPVPDFLRVLNNYNNGRGSQSFDEGGMWAPSEPARILSGHPGLPPESSIELKPEVMAWFTAATAKEAARRMSGRITPAMIANPDRRAVEFIKKEFDEARNTVRDSLRNRPVSALGEVN